MQIVNSSKNNYKGYGICFDEGSEFGHTITEGGRAHTTGARSALNFGIAGVLVHTQLIEQTIYIL